MRQRFSIIVPFILLLLATAATAATAAAAQARNYLSSDGQFTICAWSDLENCALLDSEREIAMRLTEKERQNLVALRRFASLSAFSGQQLIDTFGQPWISYKDADDAVTIGWSYPAGGGDSKSSIGMGMVANKLSFIRYSVYEKCVVYWYADLSSTKGKVTLNQSFDTDASRWSIWR